MNANVIQLVTQLNAEWDRMTSRVKAIEDRLDPMEGNIEKRMQELKNDLAIEAKIHEHKDEWNKKFIDEGARLDQLVAALREDAKTSVGKLEEKAAALEDATAKMQIVTSEMQAEGNK